MSIFLNQGLTLRSGWKFAAYVFFFILFLWITAGLTLLAGDSTGSTILQDQLVNIALSNIMFSVPAIAAMLLTIRFMDHRPLHEFGIGLVPRWQQDFAVGLGFAAGMLALMIGGCYAIGFVSMRWTGDQAPPGALVATFGLLLWAAANEELIFRGFPLRTLSEAIGPWPAMLALSLLFGALHWQNPNASVLSTINTVVAGILLSLAYTRTGSLWMPYGIHVVWNLGLGFVFGFPLSGIDIASLWTTGIAGSDLLLGGGYGPEGGLLMTFVFAGAAVIVEKRYRSRTSR